MISKRLVLVILLFCLPVAALAEEGEADVGWQGWGVRVGLADDPDQLVVGAQFDLGEFAPRVRFEPNVELGFGDDHTILAGTAAVHYRFERHDRVTPFVGGGLTAALVDVDAPGSRDDTDFEMALRAVGGSRWALRKGREFLLELDLVFGDVHDIQMMAGWMF